MVASSTYQVAWFIFGVAPRKMVGSNPANQFSSSSQPLLLHRVLSDNTNFKWLVRERRSRYFKAGLYILRNSNTDWYTYTRNYSLSYSFMDSKVPTILSIRSSRAPPQFFCATVPPSPPPRPRGTKWFCISFEYYQIRSVY